MQHKYLRLIYWTVQISVLFYLSRARAATMPVLVKQLTEAQAAMLIRATFRHPEVRALIGLAVPSPGITPPVRSGLMGNPVPEQLLTSPAVCRHIRQCQHVLMGRL